MVREGAVEQEEPRETPYFPSKSEQDTDDPTMPRQCDPSTLLNLPMTVSSLINQDVDINED